jgi:subtilisin family serine protease
VSLLPRAGFRRPVFLALAGAATTALALATATAAQAQPAAPADSTALYLVELAGAPVASYTGTVPGIPATKPADGAKLNQRAWNYQAYRDYLRSQRTSVLRTAGVDAGKAVAEYSVAFNGVALRLTSAEAARMSKTPGVAKVFKNEILTVDTISTPRFLGLDGPSGTWAQQFGDVSHAGEGIVVGVVDTGFWPENPSFAPLSEPRPDQAVIDSKWFGTCVPGDDHVVACNNKVIGARFYDAGGLPKHAGEFHSPRDFDGHGSHTASTAAGDNGVTATINGLAVGQVTGMAPAARIAAYKALWERPDGTTASGATVDLVNAIDDAVADGVDVINYSISGSTSSVIDPVEIAFLNAAAAGVFVATSAGNNGPGASTVAHNAPWDTTVAASSHDRGFSKSVTLGNGTTYTGVGLGPAVPSSPLIDSVNAGLAGADPTQVELCFSGTLDPAQVTGKIVLCRRGVNARVDKSNAVKLAGGVGMVLYNPTPNTLNADFHFVPTVHVDGTAGAAIKAYIAGTASPTASLSAGVQVPVRAPMTADFSSRGPAVAGGGDLLKPDITAPGVDVIAAVSPANHAGNLWDTLSGTSMSSPHIAGIAALLRSKNPAWSPMAVKSALMTTAGQLDNTGQPIQKTGGNATPLDMGAGHVRPGNAFDPGLVYESGPTEWLQYTCGIGQHLGVSDGNGGVIDVCSIVGSIDPSNLNYASISVGDLAGKQTITRTVTNVDNRASVYLARVQAPPGFSVTVTPSTLVVPPHKSASFKVEITRTSAAFGQWSFGALNWSDLRGHNVRSPISVRPVAVAAPVEVTGTGTSGLKSLSLKSGFAGTLTTAPFGLAAGAVTVQHLVGTDTSFNSSAPKTSPAVGKVTVNVPAGTKLARFATFAADYGPLTDIDLFVYQAGTSTLVGQSAGGDAQEAVTVTAAGSYDVYVVQFALDPGVTEQDVKVNALVVGPTAAGNLTASPASQAVALGGPATVTVAWNGLTAGTHYLGVVEYGDGSSTVGRTIVAVDA